MAVREDTARDVQHEPARHGRHGRPRPFGGRLRLPTLRFSGAAMAMSTVVGISIATTLLLNEQQGVGRRAGVARVGTTPPATPTPGDQAEAASARTPAAPTPTDAPADHAATGRPAGSRPSPHPSGAAPVAAAGSASPEATGDRSATPDATGGRTSTGHGHEADSWTAGSEEPGTPGTTPSAGPTPAARPAAGQPGSDPAAADRPTASPSLSPSPAPPTSPTAPPGPRPTAPDQPTRPPAAVVPGTDAPPTDPAPGEPATPGPGTAPDTDSDPDADRVLTGVALVTPVGRDGLRHQLDLTVTERVTALQAEFRLSPGDLAPGTGTAWTDLPGAVVTVQQDRGTLVYRFTTPPGTDVAPGHYTFGVRGTRPADGPSGPATGGGRGAGSTDGAGTGKAAATESWSAAAFGIDRPRAVATLGTFAPAAQQNAAQQNAAQPPGLPPRAPAPTTAPPFVPAPPAAPAPTTAPPVGATR
ncbi:hypothetical protein [Kitasatospora sp. NPDC051705]|uniref:hypothetical protein n=1 Tax=Kitasatospora sp. NPDC051705 TaxID=3364057 RepID=UPI0037BD7F9B